MPQSAQLKIIDRLLQHLLNQVVGKLVGNRWNVKLPVSSPPCQHRFREKPQSSLCTVVARTIGIEIADVAAIVFCHDEVARVGFVSYRLNELCAGPPSSL